MEELITLSNRNLSEAETIRSINTLLPYLIEQNLELTSKKEKQEDLKNTTNIRTEENYISAELFKMKGFISNEHWEKTININSKITRFNNDYVLCECLIDKERKIFEQRSFPRYLFNHIENIKSNPYVILSIQSKTGSTRINVIKGANIVDIKAFELNEEWEKLDGKDFNQPLDKPIQL